LAEEKQDDKKVEYSAYMAITHGKKPILGNNESKYFQATNFYYQSYFDHFQNTHEEDPVKRTGYKIYFGQSQMR